MADDITSKGLGGRLVDWLFGKDKPAETIEHEKYIAARSAVLSEVGTPEDEKFVKDYEARGGNISTPAPEKSPILDTGGGGGSGGGEDFMATGGNPESIVVNLAKNYGIQKALEIAGVSYGIPPSLALSILNPYAQGAMQDFNVMVDDLNPLNLFNKNKDIYSYADVTADKGASPGIVTSGIMSAGQQALGQTPAQVAAQQDAAMTTQQNNYQAPTMTQSQMVQEAAQTGGTVNPHEATKATWTPPPPRGPNLRNRAQGGIVSINDMIGSL
jgi:hypothetical protein